MHKALALLIVSLTFVSCSFLSSVFRPPLPRASPEEAARFEFPVGLPEEGRQIVTGTMVRAIQLAMEDFYPSGATQRVADSPSSACLSRRENYDVIAAPRDEAVMFVAITLAPHACEVDGGSPVLDMGALYAIDTQTWRILAVQ